MLAACPILRNEGQRFSKCWDLQDSYQQPIQRHEATNPAKKPCERSRCKTLPFPKATLIMWKFDNRAEPYQFMRGQGVEGLCKADLKNGLYNVPERLPRINIGADVWGGSSIMTGVC
jgi:hypothetical protein